MTDYIDLQFTVGLNGNVHAFREIQKYCTIDEYHHYADYIFYIFCRLLNLKTPPEFQGSIAYYHLTQCQTWDQVDNLIHRLNDHYILLNYLDIILNVIIKEHPPKQHLIANSFHLNLNILTTKRLLHSSNTIHELLRNQQSSDIHQALVYYLQTYGHDSVLTEFINTLYTVA